jgi:hypothetical protein
MKADVVVLLKGDEVRPCEQCCAPMTALHTKYWVNGDIYFTRFSLECGNGHNRVVISPLQAMDDELRELLS